MSTQVFEAADINFMISSLLLFLLRLKLFELLREARNLQAYPNWRTVLESASSLTSEGYTVEEMKEMILHQAMQTNYSLMSRQLDNSRHESMQLVMLSVKNSQVWIVSRPVFHPPIPRLSFGPWLPTQRSVAAAHRYRLAAPPKNPC